MLVLTEREDYPVTTLPAVARPESSTLVNYSAWHSNRAHKPNADEHLFESLESSETDNRRDDATDAEKLRRRTALEIETLARAVNLGFTDVEQLTDFVFFARHPDLIGTSFALNGDLSEERNVIKQYLVQPTLNQSNNATDSKPHYAFSAPSEVEPVKSLSSNSKNLSAVDLDEAATRFNPIIADSVRWCPGLPPIVLKSLLAQESAFKPDVINKYGYAGIAQLGRNEAREVGLQLKTVDSPTDERLNPAKAIPGAAKLLHIKSQRLADAAFSRYGTPDGDEFWKFALAAYNGGEGTVCLAMGLAYRKRLEQARANGLDGAQAVETARNYATKWDNLTNGGANSPLGIAAARFFPKLAASKYHEIKQYPIEIYKRAYSKS